MRWRSQSLSPLLCVSVQDSQLHCLWCWGFTTPSPTTLRGQGERIPEPGVLNTRSWLKCIPIQKRHFLTSLQIACWPLMSHHHVFIFIRVLVPNGYFRIYLSGGRGLFCFVFLLSLFLPTLNSIKSALWKSNFICLVQCHIPSTQHNRILAGTHQMFVK